MFLGFWISLRNFGAARSYVTQKVGVLACLGKYEHVSLRHRSRDRKAFPSRKWVGIASLSLLPQIAQAVISID